MPALTAAGCRQRRRRLFDRFEQIDAPLDWVVITDPEHLMYFAGFYLPPFVFRTTNAAGVLLMGKEGESILVADGTISAYADEAHVDRVVAPVWYRAIESAPHRESLLIATTLETIDECPGESWGYEPSRAFSGVIEGLRHRCPDADFIDVDPTIHEMKRRKDDDEIAVLKRSMASGEAAHAAALANVKPGMTEQEIYLLVHDAANRTAGEQVIVYGDFVTGLRTGQGGGPPTSRKVEASELVLLDFSVVVGGYRGDFANTFVCGADPTEEQERLAAACMDALSAGEATVRAGVDAREIDRAVRGSFAAKHLEENFVSHAGHGLGLGHPDPPYLVRESTDTLVAGDVIAIEPHQIFPGRFGMRFERNYLVTDDGFETLSNHALTLHQS